LENKDSNNHSSPQRKDPANIEKQGSGEYYLVSAEEYHRFREWAQEDIDWNDVVEMLWQNRWFIGKITITVTIIGLVLSLLMSSEYTSTTSLMPEYKTQSSVGGTAQDLLQKYGGMLGLSGGTYASNSNAIRIELYPKIVQSLSFQLTLVNHKFHYSAYDTTASVFAYVNSIHHPSVLAYVLAYTVELPLTVKAWISYWLMDETELKDSQESQGDIINISEAKMRVVKMMQNRVWASLDQESGVISVQATMPNPKLAAAVTKLVINNLTAYLKKYRTRKLKVNLGFMKKEYQKAKARFDTIQDSLAAFRDNNRNIATAAAQTKQQRLQSKYDLANKLYTGLANQLEQTKLQLQEQTPMFKTLQPVQVPLEKSSPNRILITLVSFILGGVGAVGYLFGQQWMQGRF